MDEVIFPAFLSLRTITTFSLGGQGCLTNFPFFVDIEKKVFSPQIKLWDWMWNSARKCLLCLLCLLFLEKN